MATITLTTKLPDGNGDDIIDVSAAGATKYGVPKAGRWYYLPGEADYTYTDVKPTAPVEPPVEPPVVTPPPPPPAPEPTGKSGLFGKEAYAHNDVLSVGFNAFGGIGTLQNVPEGVPTDIDTGLKRAGLFTIDGKPANDIILQGRAIEGFSLIIGGKRYANMQLTGFQQIPGGFKDAFTWEGSVAGVTVKQVMKMTGKRLDFTVTLTNSTATGVSVGYLRAADPDQSDKYSTTNRLATDGWECLLPGGSAFSMLSDDKRAKWATAEYNKAMDAGTYRTAGSSVSGDYVVQMVVPLGTLATKASDTVSFSFLVED